MTPGLTDPDAWLAQHGASGGAAPPTDPDAWLAQQNSRPPSGAGAAPAGPSWLPASMRQAIGETDTSRFEKARQEGWKPFQQIGRGAKTAVTGPDMQTRASGAHEALTGAMDVGAHLLPAVAPMNPLGTAAGIAAGTAAGFGTQQGLKAAGVPEPYANLAGDVAGIAAGGLAGKGVSRMTGGGLVGADPETLSWQALQPRGGSEAHYSNAPIVMGDIKAAAVRRGLPIRSARDLAAKGGAIDAALNDNRDAFGQHWDQVQQRIPTDHVGDLIDQTIDPETRRLASLGDPEAQAHVDAVHSYANTFRGQTVTPDEFRQLQEHVNAEDDVFQKKTDEKQAKIIAARGGDPTIRAKAAAFRDLVRQYAGDDAADIQTRYGLLRDWKAAGLKAMDKALNEKAGTVLQKGAQAADVPGQIVTGNIDKTPPLRGTTDQKIQWAFDKTQPGPPLPLPQAISGTQGAVSNIFQGVSAPRLLPQGSAPFTQGTSAINPTANPPRGGPGSYRAGLLGPGSPTQGQGVIQAPPAGAANKFTGGPPLIQVPRGPNAAAPEEVSPRTAEPPEDTSFVRGVSVPASDPTFYRMPIAQQMAKQVWEAAKPKAEEAPAAAPAPIAAAPPTAPAPEPEAPAKVSPAVVAKAKRQAPPGAVDTRLEKALGTLREGMAKTRQAPPGTPPPQTAPPEAAPKAPPESLSDAQIAEAQKVSGIKDQLENVKYYQYGAGSRLPTAAVDRAAAISELMESLSPTQAKRILEAGQ